jgi:mRNA interferase YafQ
MRTIRRTNQFKKDYKRETKGRSANYTEKFDSDLTAVTRVLTVDGALEDRHRDHLLMNEWKNHRDCHIRPDLVLIYRKPDGDTLELVRIGSHSELGLK